MSVAGQCFVQGLGVLSGMLGDTLTLAGNDYATTASSIRNDRTLTVGGVEEVIDVVFLVSVADILGSDSTASIVNGQLKFGSALVVGARVTFRSNPYRVVDCDLIQYDTDAGAVRLKCQSVNR